MISYGSLCTWIAILTILSICINNEVNASGRYSKDAYGSKDSSDSRASSSRESGSRYGNDQPLDLSRKNYNTGSSAGGSKYPGYFGSSNYPPGSSGNLKYQSSQDSRHQYNMPGSSKYSSGAGSSKYSSGAGSSRYPSSYTGFNGGSFERIDPSRSSGSSSRTDNSGGSSKYNSKGSDESSKKYRPWE
ncbi:secreted protein C-like isoform X5 [Leptopilina heterotoma]|uniref:secreted protein C-like isoform X5 n=1 Tax=Leptopilina heterotoma TaxID=63436 RepID=UPI001CA862DA|nr:secreted protein C-like isoform X5 [Leptopilina heterotoma]